MEAAPTTRKECDLVLEGGLVSGLVYPAAVLALHEDYDFRCVGGASAAAYVAAATAAAQASRDSRGFERLREFCDELATPGLVTQLFQPWRGTEPLLRAALSAMRAAGEGTSCWISRVLRALL